MRYSIFILIAVVFLASCKEEKKLIVKSFTSVEIEDIYTDSTLSIRAIELLNDKSLAFAANDGVYGLYDPKANSWNISVQKLDTFNLHFRAIAKTSTDFFMLSIENPALLFKTGDNGSMDLVYIEENKKVFYDAMTFWNDREGIAIGDPTDDCLSVIITRNGGESWTKLPCSSLPKIKDGEAAFAASNTNIAVSGDDTWVATGGKTSRIFYSPDKGKSWQVYETPMIKGLTTTGIYSIDFYDVMNGFAVGGDYTNPEDSKANKMITSDGGKTWKLVGDGNGVGYRSCVQYIPNHNADALVTVGLQGVDYSSDKGVNWKHLSDEAFHTIRFLNDSVAYAAGDGRISKLYFK